MYKYHVWTTENIDISSPSSCYSYKWNQTMVFNDVQIFLKNFVFNYNIKYFSLSHDIGKTIVLFLIRQKKQKIEIRILILPICRPAFWFDGCNFDELVQSVTHREIINISYSQTQWFSNWEDIISKGECTQDRRLARVRDVRPLNWHWRDDLIFAREQDVCPPHNANV